MALTSAGVDPEGPLDFPREWIEFIDPADAEHWIRADMTWLCSRWTCIFGRGCHGTIEGQSSTGCCNHGAYFSDKRRPQARAQLRQAVDPEDWQLYDEGRDAKGRSRTRRRSTTTTRTDPRRDGGRCLHVRQPRGTSGWHRLRAARPRAQHGLNPLETKPEVCWQLPVRREQDWVERPDETKVLRSTIAEFDRRGWGEGGHDLDWYCTTSPEAHIGHEPMYVSYAPELIALIGEPAYQVLAELCGRLCSSAWSPSIPRPRRPSRADPARPPLPRSQRSPAGRVAPFGSSGAV